MEEEEKLPKRQLILVGIAVLLTGILLIVKPTYSVFQVNKTINIMDAKVGNFGVKNLKDSILVQNGGSTAIEAKGSPDFSKPSTGWEPQGTPIVVTLASGTNCFADSFTFDGTYYKVADNCQVVNSFTKTSVGYYALKEGYKSPYTSSTLYYITGYIDSTTAEAIEFTSSNTPEFIPSGMYAMEDEYGMSYYFRGAKDVVNNNVIFGGFQWKVLRINGDGSIRLIYNGTEEQFDTSGAVNIYPFPYDGLYGSMYGVASNANVGLGYIGGIGGANYYETHYNGNPLYQSLVKTQLDNWYANNISGEAFEDKIVDNVFCNDRNINTVPDVWALGDTALGYGTNITYYAAYNRLVNNNAPTLKCTNTQGSVPATNDQFTVSQIAYNHQSGGTKTIGNGLLTYPIGLVTADEMVVAGAKYGTTNKKYYLYINSDEWTMTPAYNHSGATVFRGYVYGDLSVGHLNFTTFVSRPLINLSSEVTYTLKGSGTPGSATNPYIVL